MVIKLNYKIIMLYFKSLRCSNVRTCINRHSCVRNPYMFSQIPNCLKSSNTRINTFEYIYICNCDLNFRINQISARHLSVVKNGEVVNIIGKFLYKVQYKVCPKNKETIKCIA